MAKWGPLEYEDKTINRVRARKAARWLEMSRLWYSRPSWPVLLFLDTSDRFGGCYVTKVFAEVYYYGGPVGGMHLKPLGLVSDESNGPITQLHQCRKGDASYCSNVSVLWPGGKD